ncbi:MAG: 50S ribosomal protein L6 [Thermoflexales bacterium]|nr:50S ribosomal protein L6 [Thermoflexales bacterium]MDW8351290.1 50S ribosomal protein L6 [Anaerolineae bacterium]
MSRIGRKPIELPKGVDVAINGSLVTVKGPKGELKRTFPPQIRVLKEGNVVRVQREGDEDEVRALHGLSRALLANMVKGVSDGYQKVLEIGAESVGYRAEMSGGKLVLYLGYSHPIEFPPPPGITFSTDAKTRTITISGIDKELVGEVAAQVRKLRPPEPYKGKGLRYQGEVIRRKAGKAGKTGKGK